MSSFMSEKFLRYARLDPSDGLVEEGRVCEGCGYDLRGLRLAGQCPECGTPISGASTASEPHAGSSSRPSASVAPAPDPLLTLPPEHRGRVRTAASVVAMVAAFALVDAIGSSVASVVAAGTGSGRWLFVWLAMSRAILTTILAVALAGFAVPSLWVLVRGFRPQFRWPVLATIVLWPVGAIAGAFAAWHAADPVGSPVTAAMAEMLGHLSVGGRFLGGLAAITIAVVAYRAAEDAELESAVWRLGTTILLLPIFGLLRMVFGGPMPWIFLFVFWIAILFPWCWLVIRASLAFRDIAAHLMWSDRAAAHAPGKGARMAERRAELDAQWRGTIRDLPPDAPDALGPSSRTPTSAVYDPPSLGDGDISLADATEERPGHGRSA